MKRPEENKAILPDENKAEMVKIKFKPNRAAEDVPMDAKREASVDAALAAYLVNIGYADYVKEA